MMGCACLRQARWARGLSAPSRSPEDISGQMKEGRRGQTESFLKICSGTLRMISMM